MIGMYLEEFLKEPAGTREQKALYCGLEALLNAVQRHSNRQGSGVASEYSKAGIDTFWKIPFKNNYIYVRPEYCVWQK